MSPTTHHAPIPPFPLPDEGRLSIKTLKASWERVKTIWLSGSTTFHASNYNDHRFPNPRFGPPCRSSLLLPRALVLGLRNIIKTWIISYPSPSPAKRRNNNKVIHFSVRNSVRFFFFWGRGASFIWFVSGPRKQVGNWVRKREGVGWGGLGELTGGWGAWLYEYYPAQLNIKATTECQWEKLGK